MPSPITFDVSCPCGCGETVTATDAGFSATTIDIAACPMLAEAGIASTRVRKTDGYALTVTPVVLRHQDGLVTFGGSL